MSISRGYGFLVIGITLVIVAIFTLIFKSFDGREGLGEGLGAILSGPIIWIVGKNLNNPKKYTYMVDPRTGREVIFSAKHSMLSIKFQYWAFIIAGLGIITCLKILFRK